MVYWQEFIVRTTVYLKCSQFQSQLGLKKMKMYLPIFVKIGLERANIAYFNLGFGPFGISVDETKPQRASRKMQMLIEKFNLLNLFPFHKHTLIHDFEYCQLMSSIFARNTDQQGSSSSNGLTCLIGIVVGYPSCRWVLSK